MSSEVDVQVLQRTQKLLGKYIKKPPLTEKLLRKPPFRFLHDVVSAVIREAGFLKGLYSERELVSENVKEKDDKIAFLNKLIDATKAITGTHLAVKATKVIAGLEATETNLLLQAIGTALDKKLDSSQYVTQRKSEKKPKAIEKKAKTERSKEKDGSKLKEKDKTTSKNAALKTSNKVKTEKTSSRDSKESVRNETKAHAKAKKTPKEKITPRDSKKNLIDNINENKIKTPKEDDNLKKTNDVGIVDELKEDTPETASTTAAAKQENTVEEPVLKLDLQSVNNGSSNLENHLKEEALALVENLNINKEEIQPANTDDSHVNEENKEIPIPKIERVKSARLKINNLEINNKPNEIEDKIEKPQKPSEIEDKTEKPLIRPKSSLRPPSVRPSSARPGAPRLRSDISLQEGEVVPLGKVNVILENYNTNDADEEDTVTIQAAPDPEFQAPILQMPTDKGHLVEQILEQISQDGVAEHVTPTVNIEWEKDGFRGRNAINREIEQLKSAIQTLTKAANPLGKLVSYLHEDIEAMHSELDMWTNSARQITADIANQKRRSFEMYKPLQVQLEEIEDNITKYKQQIMAVHGDILQNEQRIQSLLMK